MQLIQEATLFENHMMVRRHNQRLGIKKCKQRISTAFQPTGLFLFQPLRHASAAASSGDVKLIPNGAKCFVLRVTTTRLAAFAIPATAASAIPGS